MLMNLQVNSDTLRHWELQLRLHYVLQFFSRNSVETITLSWVVGTLFLWLSDPSDFRTLPFISSHPSKISIDVNVLGVTHAPYLPETPYSFY